MKDLMTMQVIEGSHKLLGEIEKGIERWRSKILKEIFESSRNIFHEDAGFMRKVIMLEVSYYVFMVHFGKNCNL